MNWSHLGVVILAQAVCFSSQAWRLSENLCRNSLAGETLWDLRANIL
jgi:hypothetical protein